VERLYKALVWLAGVAIVTGLAFSAMYTTQAASNYAQVPHVSLIDGMFAGFFTGLYVGDLPYDVRSVAFLCACGVTLLALALAWSNRRYGWLLALLIATLLALLWPTWVEAWTLRPFTMFQPYPPVTAALETQIFSGYAVPLVPVVLALIFALTRRPPAPSAQPGAALATS